MPDEPKYMTGAELASLMEPPSKPHTICRDCDSSMEPSGVPQCVDCWAAMEARRFVARQKENP